MGATLRQRLDAIDWESYDTAYGPAVGVPDQLFRLSLGGREASDAGHALWCGLCHQHAYVSSAALPALPFLLAVLESADEAVAADILDILAGFAACTLPECEPLPEWAIELRRRVTELLPRLRELSGHANESIAAYAGLAIEHLEGPDGIRPTACPDVAETPEPSRRLS